LTTNRFRRLWENDYLQTVIVIVLMVVFVFGFWFGLKWGLNTDYPMLAVASGSMCTVEPNHCDGWTHPFSMSLHTGDLIVVQGINPKDIYAAPFNASGKSGDIIVFNNIQTGELIVHRAIELFDNDTVKTQGDGNTLPGPPKDGNVAFNQVVGKVVLRIPWIGHLALIMRDPSGVYLLLALIIVIVAVELVLSLIGDKKSERDTRVDTEDAEFDLS
jgi:signal peptidase I